MNHWSRPYVLAVFWSTVFIVAGLVLQAIPS